MNEQTKLLFALTQVENIAKLMEGNQWEGFFRNHLINIRVELNRQLALQNARKTTI